MEHTDFDGLLVTGTPSCLTNILSWVQVSIGDNLPTNSRFRDMLLLSAVPYQIWIDQEYKIPIIEALSDKRNTPLVSSINSHQILKNPIRVLGKDLINLLNELEVDEIQVYGFGTKSPITTGIELMKEFRKGDPQCTIRFDAGIEPSSLLAPFTAPVYVQENSGKSVTLARISSSNVESTFGETAKTHHLPILFATQARVMGFEAAPLFGGFTIDMMFTADHMASAIKVYNKIQHLVMTHFRNSFSRGMSVKEAQLRLNILKLVGENIESCAIRIESTHLLPLYFDTTAEPDQDVTTIAFIWKTLADVYRNTDLIHLSALDVEQDLHELIAMVTNKNWTRDNAGVNVFRRRAGLSLGKSYERNMLSLVFGALGQWTDKLDKMFGMTFIKNGNWNPSHFVEAPILWFLFEFQKWCIQKNLGTVFRQVPSAIDVEGSFHLKAIRRPINMFSLPNDITWGVGTNPFASQTHLHIELPDALVDGVQNITLIENEPEPVSGASRAHNF